MPTPPPWWIETQVAPAATLSMAFKSGQSETASEPSRIASVSRLGRRHRTAESRWSRPITIGAFNSPLAHHLVEHQPGAVAVAEADPADARGQALEGDPLARHVEPAVQVLVLREERLHRRVGAVDVFRVAGERRPAERARCRGRRAGGCRRGQSPGRRRRSQAPPPWRPGGCCCRSRASARPHSRTRPSRRHGSSSRRARPSRRSSGRFPAWRATRQRSSRQADSRAAGHAPRSGR